MTTRLSGSNSTRSRRNQGGFTLIATAICLALLLGMAGLAIDLGRVFIARNEAQAFADATALAAVQQLNGKTSGIQRALAAVSDSRRVNRWNMSTVQFTESDSAVAFSTSSSGPWTSSGPANAKFVRVTATPGLRMSLVTVLGGPPSQMVTARSVAGLVEATFPKGGYLPYRVVAHETRNDANFGLQVGQAYTLRWPGNARVGSRTCPGDNAQEWIDAAGAGGSSERGYFELQSAAAIRAAILGQRQLMPLNVGDILNMTNGNKQTERDALEILAARDTDQTAYEPNANGIRPAYNGNGSRLVFLPISASATGDTSALPNIAGNQVLGFGAFLLPMSHDNQGNASWCAIYMGAKSAGSTDISPLPIAAAFVTKLVQ